MSATSDALKAKLDADVTVTSLATGGVWVGPAASEVAKPIVRIDLQSSPQFPTFNDEGYEQLTYTVRGITTDDSGSTLAAAIDTALQRTALTITGRRHLNTVRVGRIEYPEVRSGVTYYHEGARYLVTVA